MDDKQHFWSGFAKSLGYEPRDDTKLIGESGLEHCFAAFGVDERRKRILAVSGELDPKVAALVHADVSTKLGEYRLSTVRPITFDVQALAQFVQLFLGVLEFDINATMERLQSSDQRAQEGEVAPQNTESRTSITALEALSEIKKKTAELGIADVVMPFARAAALSGLAPVEQVVLLIRQIALYDWTKILPNPAENRPLLSLKSIFEINSQKSDRDLGTCPVPLYELTEMDWELFKSGVDVDGIQERLMALGIHQYFYPPVDQAVLAIVEKGRLRSHEIDGAIAKLSTIGHAPIQPELVQSAITPMEIVEALQEKGYLVEGEFGYDVSDPGKAVRAVVRFRPREGVFSKLFQKFNINLTLPLQ